MSLPPLLLVSSLLVLLLGFHACTVLSVHHKDPGKGLAAPPSP